MQLPDGSRANSGFLTYDHQSPKERAANKPLEPHLPVPCDSNKFVKVLDIKTMMHYSAVRIGDPFHTHTFVVTLAYYTAQPKRQKTVRSQ